MSNWINELKIKESDLKKIAGKINQSASANIPHKQRLNWVLAIYSSVKASVSEKDWKRAEKLRITLLRITQLNFLILTKAIAAVTIFYFATVPYFGITLYIVTVVLLLLVLTFLWLAYPILDVFPLVLQKIDCHFNRILQQEIENQRIATEDDHH